MDRLDFLTEDELIRYFRRAKTEISCIEEPHVFLSQLRDHDLVPDDLYKKVMRMRNKVRKEKGVYEILDWLEDNRGEHMKIFWSCVFQDHIQQKYPTLRLLRNTLLDDFHKIDEKLPNAPKPGRNKDVQREEKKQEQKKGTTKRKKTGEDADEEEPGPSSVSRQKKLKPTFSLLLKKGELPVTCGDKKGTLYPDKLARGDKCILYQDRWFTPNEFERLGGKGRSKNWKLTVRYKNIPLQKLLKDGRLKCPRTYRVKRRKLNQCYICNTGGKLVCCNVCPRTFHHRCHLPTLHEDTLGHNWMCTWCVFNANHRLWIHMDRNGALRIPVSGNIMRCEYLLLCLYKEDTQHVFTGNPTTRMGRSSSVTTNPMWLNRVKAKLQKNKYTTVGQFVRDINLIFINCQVFNRFPGLVAGSEAGWQAGGLWCFGGLYLRNKSSFGAETLTALQDIKVSSHLICHLVNYCPCKWTTGELCRYVNGSPSDPMDPLDFLTEEEMMQFFHRKKTEISCMEEPHTFLNQLRDHNLVSEKLYQKVIKMKSKERKRAGVYEILDWLENERGQFMKLFWRCVFQDHILQKYPVLRLLRNSLLDASAKYYERLPDMEEVNSNKKEPVQEQKMKVKGKKEGKRKKSVEETDEEEEEEEEEPGPSSCSTPTQRKPTRKPTFSSPLKKGKDSEIWTWDLYKTCLPVNCGDKKGTLHRGKLARGIPCILSNGKWFIPSGFEKFAGKGYCKNWKSSIRCLKTPLQKLIQAGHLQCPRIKRWCVRKSQKVLFPISSAESSSSQSSVEMEGSDEEQEEEDDSSEEEESEPVSLLEFEAAVLPVSCGSITGDLYKKRFAGSRCKSIRTEERWFTPEEFIKQELTLTDSHWKKDILCHGKPLNYLVKKKILFIHSLLCTCDQCAPEDPLAQNNDDICFICNSDEDDDGDLVCCDECPRAFHQDCHLPTPHDDTDEDKWMCTFCVWKINHQMWIPMSLEDTLNSPVSQNIMNCEYLLLCLYKEDKQRGFTDDPFMTVPGYSRVISNPMWLNRVKTKLQKNEYSTVREFVGDLRLIFQNCQTFYKDNDFGMMGARLSESFEQKFRIVFKIQ
ncbi:uncharacterized protein LOC132870279 [Neoarius graeffei]|uniref:uncharacterized protein LOC132870279 n=1 Tax=Neoarius graeffei TaxID=443677 RepID=UPI00298D2F14|nr:uncharacterized protein LOC132870279 [Neoarius graeffei]